jgi:hypothetical protein
VPSVKRSTTWLKPSVIPGSLVSSDSVLFSISNGGTSSKLPLPRKIAPVTLPFTAARK